MAAGLIVMAGLTHLGLAAAAISGVEALQANVDELERTITSAGVLANLSFWGWTLGLIGVLELWAAAALCRRTDNARLVGLITAYGGLTASLFTLAILRLGALIALALLFGAIYLLSYHSGERV